MEAWEAYRATARDNLEFAKALYASKEKIYYHWIVVILFHSSMHYIHAIMTKNGTTIPDHHKDKIINSITIKGVNSYAENILGSQLHTCYMSLESTSWAARYMAPPPTKTSQVDKGFRSAGKIAKFAEELLLTA